MSSLRTAAESYLAIRRSLGFKLEQSGRLLLDFVDYLEDAGASTVTTELAVAWATKPRDADPVWWSQRLSVVRCFARHLQASDPTAEVPPDGLLPARPRRATPYLFSPADINQTIAAASTLGPPLRAATYQTLIGLLAVTGMRKGEAFGLDRDDVDLGNGLITIRHAKFDKSRQLPLHPTTVEALGTYARLRDEHFPRPTVPSFFVSTAGGRLSSGLFNPVFRSLAHKVGLVERSPRCRPRPHDLRHSFAVNSLIGWYRDGVDVEARLPALSTWLGHVDPANTYWYLSAAPELLALAGQRLEDALGGAAMSALAPTVEAFFTQRLIAHRHASPNTIAAYRDALRLLFAFAQQQTGKSPSQLDLADLDTSLIAAFLRHLEHERETSPRTRNARLSAIHSLFRFAALHHPEHAALIQRVLAIPQKRHENTIVSFLTGPEIHTLLAAPDRTTRIGRRDHALLLVAIQTGLRVSELVALRRRDLQFNVGAHVRCHGKGRKERCTPLTAQTVKVLRVWLKELRRGARHAAFPRPARRSARPGRRQTARRQARRSRPNPLSVTARQTRHPPRVAPHRRDAAPAGRGGLGGHRSLARSRERPVDSDLHARRPHAQRTSVGAHHPAEHHPWTLPAIRPVARLPRRAVIMPTL